MATKEKEKVQLHKRISIIRGLPYLEFSEDNEIIFYQDFNWWKGLPSETKFYIEKLSSNGVWLVADGYGALTNNRFGLPHNYGNGSICIDFKYLTEDIEKYCKKHFNESMP